VLRGWGYSVTSLLGLSSLQQWIKTKERVMSAIRSLFTVFAVNSYVFRGL
jgi:hypothetical protein